MNYNTAEISVCSLNLEPRCFGKILGPLMALCFDARSGKYSNMALIVAGEEPKSIESVLLERIAAHVEDGSYIEMHGSGGQRWRWIFSGGDYQKVYAELIWPTAITR